MTSLADGRSPGSKTNASTKRSAKAEPTKRGGQPALAFEVRSSPIQGLGGFATRRIRKGAIVVEYVGERVSDEEADRRYDDEAMDRHHTFLFSLGDGTSIDAAVNGNEARFINHSCAPNCEAVNDGGQIFIEALRDIEPGEELFYDYAYERGGGDDEDEDEDAIARMYACNCGAPTCRGSILAPPKEKKPSKKKKKAAAKQKRAPSTKGRGASKAPNKGRAGAKTEGGRARSKTRG